MVNNLQQFSEKEKKKKKKSFFLGKSPRSDDAKSISFLGRGNPPLWKRKNTTNDRVSPLFPNQGEEARPHSSTCPSSFFPLLVVFWLEMEEDSWERK